MTELAKWEGFYSIVGSAAATLIGLQFVALTLIAQRPVRSPEAGAAFASPTVIHFSAALLLAALLRAPWASIVTIAWVWGVVGGCGVIYSIIVWRRLQRQNLYEPVLEDWIFHVVLPLAAYAMLAGSAIVAASNTRAALFTVAWATLIQLFVGIHNAWDAVEYHVFVKMAGTSDKDASG